VTTATLLVIIGSVVCLKTLAFVGFAVRRGRRQRRALDVAAEAVTSAEAAALLLPPRAPTDPSGWRLQWAEPGVLLVENTSDDVAARDVELRATLTASSGTAASIEQAVRFVGTGACFTARFAELERWLADAADAAAAALGRDREAASRRLGCTLSYSMAWLTPDGERRRESRVAQAVVPLPDLA
jgi:hypothetical protein